MIARVKLSMYGTCRECAKEFGKLYLMKKHSEETGHVVIGTESHRIIIKKAKSCIVR